ncbi:hypothetical protein PoB_004205800 [Plakobranchus ocellatus]|uniref:Uncharacterized protein n=1 Tax=Plakobranchus ocellatus TaxID=259542 RepID=A0AAV4B9S1_9GAST|nr:hypothetical protein PoB_004205800 [Plakobranchus ocellatus]
MEWAHEWSTALSSPTVHSILSDVMSLMSRLSRRQKLCSLNSSSPVHNKVISSFRAPVRPGAPVAGPEPADLRADSLATVLPTRS